MRTAWTRDELDGAFLVWLVEVHFPGQIVRYATHTVDVADGSASYHYPGTSDPMVYAEKADLFDRTPSTSEMGISGYVAADLPTMYGAGFRFSHLFAEVSQVRAKEHPEGLEVLDEYSDRRVLIAGRTRNPQWGRILDDGHTWFAADIVTEWFTKNLTIPAQGLNVNNATWPAASRAAEDEGVSFPIVIGYPGWDSKSDVPVPAAPVCWLDRHYETWQLICAGYGVLGASTMMLVRAVDPTGESVNLSTEYDVYGDGVSTLYPSVTHDGTGSLLTVVDYHTNGYGHGGGSPLDAPYWPTSEQESDVYVAFTEGQGGMMWRGQVLRGAGSVLSWAMEQTGYRVDYGTLAAAAPYLDRFKIDTIISAQVVASEWLQTSLLPLLPVSLVAGPYGVKVYAWRGVDVGPDECTVVDADADNLINVSDTVFDDESDTANRFTIRYGWGAIAKETRYTLRIGPGVGTAPESDDFATTFIDSTKPRVARLRLIARNAGYAGAGIRVVVTNTSPENAFDTGTDRVDIWNNVGTSTIDSLEALVNTNSALLRAVSEGDGTTPTTGDVVPADSRTFLLDYGTIPDSRCEASRVRRQRESDTGVVDAPEVEAPIVMDHTTARSILEWMVALRSSPRSTVSIEGPDDLLTNLRPLDPVLYTHTPHAFDRRIGWAEEVEHHSDGRVAVRMVFLD